MRTRALVILAIVLASLGLCFVCSRADAQPQYDSITINCVPGTEKLGADGVVKCTLADPAPFTAQLTLSPDGGVQMLDAGTVPPDAPLPSDQLADPIADPLGALADGRQSTSEGWAIGVLAILVMLVKGLRTAGKRWPNVGVLKWLAKNEAAVIGSGVISVGVIAAYNALALGGSPFAVVIAALGAAFLFMQSPTPRATA